MNNCTYIMGTENAKAIVDTWRLLLILEIKNHYETIIKVFNKNSFCNVQCLKERNKMIKNNHKTVKEKAKIYGMSSHIKVIRKQVLFAGTREGT